VWNTPNNVLHQNGFGDAVPMEIFFSFCIGLVLSIVVYRSKDKYSSVWLYRSSLVMSTGLAATPPLVFLMAFVAVMFFGVTV